MSRMRLDALKLRTTQRLADRLISMRADCVIS